MKVDIKFITKAISIICGVLVLYMSIMRFAALEIAHF